MKKESIGIIFNLACLKMDLKTRKTLGMIIVPHVEQSYCDTS